MPVKTRLARAIDELGAAAGDRPFIVITERTHKVANCSSLNVTHNNNMRYWEILGMLRQATLRQERDLSNAVSGPPPDEVP